MTAMCSRIPIFASTLAVALALMSAGPAAGDAPRPAKTQQNGTLSPEEVRALVERLRANQHGNDAALAEYERRERRYAWKHSAPETVTDDKTYRVVPTGTGTLKLILEEKGQRISDENYGKQLRELERVLENALNPGEPKQRQAVEKWEKKTRERRELVDAVPEAFLFTWLGRERVGANGRTYAKLQLDPNPDFKSRSRNTDLFQHVRAIVWVDEGEGQIVRAEAEVIRDIGVFGGVFGKVYKGGKFVMEQMKVAEGVWLPSRYEFDFDGRRFVFPFSVNEVTLLTQFRRIGPPAEALAAVRREIQNGARPGLANSSK